MKCPNINDGNWKAILKEKNGNVEEAYNEWYKQSDLTLFNEKLKKEGDYYKDGGVAYPASTLLFDNMYVNNERYTPEKLAEYFYNQQSLDKTEEINFYHEVLQENVSFSFDSFVDYFKYINERNEKMDLLLQQIVKKNGKVDNDFGLTQQDVVLAKNMYAFAEEEGMFNYDKSDKIVRNKVINLEFSHKLNDKTFTGVADTISEYVEHNDGTVSLRDYRGVPQNDIVLGNILKEYGNLKITPQEKVKLKAAFQAFLIKANRPQTQFRDISVIQIPQSGEDNLITVNATRELRIFLPIIEKYLKKNSDSVFDEKLFDYKNYVPKNEALDQKKKAILKKYKDKTQFEIFSLVERDILDEIDFNKRQALKTNNETLINEYNTKIIELIEMLDEHKTGYSSIRTGDFATELDRASANLNTRYRTSNPLARLFNDLWSRAIADLKRSGTLLSNQFKQYLDPVTPTGKFKKANYKEQFNWFWNGSDMITYKSDKWKSLSQEQKEYLDYTRWTMRFELFRTMNPAKGYDFIQAELNTRKDFVLDKAILEDQLSILMEQISINPVTQYKTSFNKFERYFSYYEGWIPKIPKSEEEKSMKEYLTDFTKYELSAQEKNELSAKKLNKRLEHNGYPLRYIGNDKDMSKYTYNPNIIFMTFMENVLKKQHLDDVINVGDGVVKFMQMEDIKNNSTFLNGVTTYMKNMIDSAILQKNTTSELWNFNIAYNRTTPEGEKQRVEKTLSMDKMARGFKNYVSAVALGFQPVGAIRRGVSGALILGINTVSNELAKLVGIKNIDFDSVTAMSAWSSSLFLGTKEMKQKIKLMSAMFGNLPDGYDGVGKSQTSFIKRADPWLFKYLKDQGFALDRWFDNTHYNTVMVAQLKAMKLADGKSMWDHYKVVDGDLVYTGGIRGIDSVTGEEIKGLTYKEINKLRALSARMYGAYRDEERVGLESSTIGALAFQFKKFAMPIYTAAIGKPYNSDALGKYVSTGKDALGNEMLEWQDRYEEGFIRSVVSYLKLLGHTKGNFKEAFKQLNEEQQKNVIFAATKTGAFLILTGLIKAVTGDADDDDNNKIKALMNQTKREVVTEFDLYNLVRLTTSVPSAQKLYELIDGTHGLLWESVISGERIESGTFKDGYFGGYIPPYKGIPQLMKNTPGGSTVWSFYRLAIDYDSFAEEMEQLSGSR